MTRFTRKTLFSSLVSSFLATAALAQPLYMPTEQFNRMQATDLPGNDIRMLRDTSLEICLNACVSDQDCDAVTYNTAANACFLKTDGSLTEPFNGAVSYRISRTSPEALALARSRQDDLTSLPRFWMDRALAQATSLGLLYRASEMPVSALLGLADEARGASNYDSYAFYMQRALAQSDDVGLWFTFGDTMLRSTRNGDREIGTTALINAYLRSTGADMRADILVKLAERMEQANNGRQSIALLRIALGLAPSATIDAALQRAIGLFGFRIVEHQVDNNAEQPRICLTFSDPLVQTGVDYAPYLRMQGTELPVEVEQNQLCLDGARHGETYDLTVRAGLPAADGEVLEKSVDIQLYVRDRDAMVYFPGRAYVLPKTDDAALPIVSVNAPLVDLRLFRVGERGLVNAIRRGNVFQAMSDYEESDIAERLGAALWEGQADLQTELNADVTTGLPVSAFLPALEPGVYAITARIPETSETWEAAATQWFIVSDLGVETMQGVDGLHVFVRSLASAAPGANVTVQLLAVNNEILAETTTDAAGYARIDPGYLAGTGGMAPAMLTLAAAGSDFAWLDLSDGGFDLSDRGVAGRAAPGPVDIFTTTDRGIYRAGETVHATILARDSAARALEGLPLTAIIRRPDGVEFSRHLLPDLGGGGHVLSLAIPASAQRGSWQMQLYADPDGPRLSTARFLVEDFIPERIDFTMALPEGALDARNLPPLDIAARYLYGAPGAELSMEGEIEIDTTTSHPGYDGYYFGLEDDPFIPTGDALYDLPATDEVGAAQISLALPALEQTSRPLEMRVALRMADGSGRPVERTLTRPLLPENPGIGIKPLFDWTLGENENAAFDIVSINADLTPRAEAPLTWVLNRVNRRYQWYSYDGSWRWEPVTTRTRVGAGTLTTGADGAARLEYPVEWGRYELRIVSPSGAVLPSSYSFYVGWWGADGSSDTPDLLQVALDQPGYAPGDSAILRMDARMDGVALVRVVTDRLVSMQAIEVTAGETEITLPVTDEWGSGAYVIASLIRPGNADAGRNPARALGLAHAAVDPQNRALDLALDLPDATEPRGPLNVGLNVGNLEPGQRVWATVSVVDIGILNITGFQSPDPEGYYFGQRALGMELRDIYGRLIDASAASRAAIRSGGDGANIRTNAPPPTQELLARFSGPVTIAADGTATVSFELPAFNGGVRVIAVVWGEQGVGQASQDVLVRDPIVLTTTTPRFMAPGDDTRLLVELAHVSGPTGTVGVEIFASGPVAVAQGAAAFNVELAEGARATRNIPLKASRTGLGELRIVMTMPDGRIVEQMARLNVLANDPDIIRRTPIRLAANGGTFTIDGNAFADIRPGSGTVTLSVGPLAALDPAGLLAALDRYPYGCSEQLVSRALPLLYVGEVAAALELAPQEGMQARIGDTITDVLANQSSSGGFGLWRPDSGDLWLDAYVTDFLSRARALGYTVPDVAFDLALANLLNRVNYAPDFEDAGQDIAYALMVLARENRASIGDLRYFADNRADAFATAMAQAQLGTALAYYGDQLRADRMFGLANARVLAYGVESNSWRPDYGSYARDASAVLTLAAEVNSTAIDRQELARRASFYGGGYRSTQDMAWMLLATNAMAQDAAVAGATLGGAPLPLTGLRQITEAELAGPGLVLENPTGTAIEAVLTTRGAPAFPEPESSNGYRIERWYYTMDGTPVDLENVQVNDRIVAILRVQPEQDRNGRLMIVDPLPAGVEVENPNLLRAGDLSQLDWLSLDDVALHSEFRDDRFVATVNWSRTDSFQLAYIVRAISPGSFQQPAALVEDMYRPDLRGTTNAGRISIRQP
ncbi:alpha-2-macroglobulin family protein [Abyssibius alkaniclasticus]|uniref:alpha-2-macroglobulin family protein n=1 Tax=Abyssibius alkaniclasticus TaxID=2881234 RepID=UPI00405A01CE